MQYPVEPNGRIWLIGGTSESVQLAAAIAQANLPCTISVTTASARSLYPDAPMLRVWVGRLDAEGMGQFFQDQKIVAVLDASHPYAVEISRLAIAACTQFQIPYLRYERPSLGQGGKGDKGDKGGLSDARCPMPDAQCPITHKKLIHLDSFDTLLAGDYLQGQQVLLTTGYKTLPLFRPWQNRATLFARILPAIASLEAALAAGFMPDRLIAIRPPVSIDLEKALWQHWEISLVVTKASGNPGGEDVKRAVAAELGVKLVVIDRPQVDYPQKTSDLLTSVKFCQHYLFKTD